MTLRNAICIFTLLLAAGPTGCKSEAERAHEQAVKIRIAEEQQKLDAVEQRRTEYAGATSCRRVTDVSLDQNSVAVDKSHCSAEQLKLEEDAETTERQEKLGKVVREHFEKYQAVFDKMRRDAKPVKSPEQ